MLKSLQSIYPLIAKSDKLQSMKSMGTAIRCLTALARQYSQAQTFLSWTAAVDGREVLVLQGDQLSDDHWVANYPENVQARVIRPIPQRPLDYFIVRQTGRGWVTLLEAPSAANGWTAKIFVDDPLPGTDVYRFELRGIEK